MKKFTIIIALVSALLLPGCMNSDIKTEVTVQLSENEYLYTKYSGYFDISQGQTVETASPQLLSELRAEMEPSKEEAIAVLATMISKAAVPVPALSGLFNKVKATWVTGVEPNTWIITINRKVDSERVTRLLETPADIGFWETYNSEEVFQYFNNINVMLRDTTLLSDLGRRPDTTEFGREHPLFSILRPNVNSDGTFRPGSFLGFAHFNDTAFLNNLFSVDNYQAELPRDMNLLWSLKPVPGTDDYYELHTIKRTRDGRPLFPGEYIVDASVNKKMYPPLVSISMNAEGARIWENITSENIGKSVAFVMNGKVYFSPMVSSIITSGESEISADFEEEEAEDLAIFLGSGYLPPFGVKVISIK